MNARSIGLILLLAIFLAWVLVETRSPMVREPSVDANAVRAAAPATEIAPDILESHDADAHVRSEWPASPRIDESPARAAGASLEVRVLFDDEPLQGSTVEVVPFEQVPEFLIGGGTDTKTESATTDVVGVARFEDRAPGEWGVRASVRGVEGRSLLLVSADARDVHATLPLGSAGLEGDVRDLDGRAAAGARVIARQDPRPGESIVWYSVRANEAGSYGMVGIAGGKGRPILATVIDHALGESAPFEIARGETRRLDFGSAAGRASWSGFVRFPSGATFLGPARLYFTCEANATSETGYVDALGRFRIVLPAGTYTAHLNETTTVSLGRADVVGAVEQDLTAPGVVLRGRVRYVGTKHPVARGPENDALIALERRTGGAVRSGFVRGESRYAFYGLEAGSYVLTAKPWIVAGSADGCAAIEIGAGTDEMELDLSITDP